jgi:hypothetical protein
MLTQRDEAMICPSAIRTDVSFPLVISYRVELSDMRAIGESEGYWRALEQLIGTLRTARDSREIRQNTTNNDRIENRA